MSVRVLSKVFRCSEAKLADRLVLLALADAASDDGITWVYQETLAEKTRISGQQVRRSLRRLEADGSVETRKAQRGRKRINVYRVLVPGLDEPDYDRLPFVLAEPFSTTAQSVRSSESDDRASRPSTTAQSVRSLRARGSLSDPLEESLGPETASPVSTGADSPPPKLTKIDGRDVAFDALAEGCGVDPSGPRAKEVGIALNGSKKTGPGIRALFWREVLALGPDFSISLGPNDPEPRRPQDGGESFERCLAREIDGRGQLYASRMPPGSLVTPLALAKWWADLPNLPAGRLAPSSIADLRPEDL